MSKIERRLLWVANALVGGTGIAYAWMLFLLRPSDEFSVVNHSWQPHIQHGHVLTAPLLVFALGVIAMNHALLYFRSGQREGRRSGVSMISLAIPMIVSGYLLQVAISPNWRQAWSIIHTVVSLGWVFIFPVHVMTHVVARQRRRLRQWQKK